VAFSPAMAAADRAFKAFLMPHMYRHCGASCASWATPKGAASPSCSSATRAAPQDLPDEWRQGLERMTEEGRARHIADFIAGMTDRYALMDHARLF